MGVLRGIVPVVALACAAQMASAPGLSAQPVGNFSIPIDCRLGVDCWVMNYPDMAAGPDARDSVCGRRTYDGHKGTDIAVRDLAAMRRGVGVLAMADGVVQRTRDGDPDRIVKTEADRKSTNGRECGNGLVIDHGDGWTGQYCHLREGSVSTGPGRRVARGQRIGLVGASGLAAFPHVHVTFRKDGQLVDPLTGRLLSDGCGEARRSLWDDAGLSRYRRQELYAAGLTDRPVTGDGIKSGAANLRSLPRDAPAMVLWSAIFGMEKDDRLRLEIFRPDGAELHRVTRTIAKSQAWGMVYSGLRRRADTWQPGRYSARATLLPAAAESRADQTREVFIDIR